MSSTIHYATDNLVKKIPLLSILKINFMCASVFYAWMVAYNACLVLIKAR